MSRPLRIEYQNAIYHVMNRGRGKVNIFHSHAFFNEFLHCLEASSIRFGLEILAYCLMDNHYHLLVRTPKSNLGRCMRHINGIYTQRHNKMLKTDGPLFRGRYKAILIDANNYLQQVSRYIHRNPNKAILIDANNYLQQVSRYIHRNPIETKKPLVKDLKDYKYSSYPVYINKRKAPSWLHTELILSQYADNSYQKFVECEEDNEVTKFYAKKEMPQILGDKAFAEFVKQYKHTQAKEIRKKSLTNSIDIDIITELVSRQYQISSEQIKYSPRSLGIAGEARKVAMYLSQQYANATLSEIANDFSLTHYSSVSQSIRRLMKEMQDNQKLREKVKQLCQDLTP